MSSCERSRPRACVCAYVSELFCRCEYLSLEKGAVLLQENGRFCSRKKGRGDFVAGKDGRFCRWKKE